MDVHVIWPSLLELHTCSTAANDLLATYILKSNKKVNKDDHFYTVLSPQIIFVHPNKYLAYCSYIFHEPIMVNLFF